MRCKNEGSLYFVQEVGNQVPQIFDNVKVRFNSKLYSSTSCQNKQIQLI